jgi:hypothetical protein
MMHAVGSSWCPRRAGECNEGILVYTSGPGLVRGMQQDLKQSTRALKDRSWRARAWAYLGKREKRGKGKRADDLLMPIDEMRWM